jgi:uncharacterized protein (DUF885 family)
MRNLMLVLLVAFATSAHGFSALEWRSAVANERDINRLAASIVEYMTHADPVFASQIGIHGTTEDPRYFDRRLTDVSLDAWAAHYDAFLFLRETLAAIDGEALSDEDRVDHRILVNVVEQQILSVTRLGESIDALGYVTRLGEAFNVLTLRDYAPVGERLQSFGDRCSGARRYLQDMQRALLPPYVQPSATEKQLTAARLASLSGAEGPLRKVLPAMMTSAGLRPAAADGIRRNCQDAIAAIEEFSGWFDTAITPRPDGPWRLGPELYELKYRYEMDYPLGPAELLAAAEEALDARYVEIVQLARRIHDGYLADAIAEGALRPQAELDDEQAVRNVFERLSDDHPTTESLIEDSYAMAEAIVGFVEENDLIDLPPTTKLRIEDIPPHLSGDAVARIQAAPPFEPEAESVWFWDLALLGESDDFLREYNRPTLALVYIHEGVPGHFVQLEYSNRSGRIAPRVFGNGPMVEGWATFIESQLVDEGFTVYPNRQYGWELQQLAQLKLDLRSDINAIIDIRLHTTDWPEAEALALMIERGFQQEAEARAKLTRAKLSSVQLTTYFAGYRAIEEILAEYRARQGDAFTWKDFNERLLGAGSPPFFALRERMLGR